MKIDLLDVEFRTFPVLADSPLEENEFARNSSTTADADFTDFLKTCRQAYPIYCIDFRSKSPGKKSRLPIHWMRWAVSPFW